ncbi:MAG: hypothetical protein CR997_10775 [Acidobacteria bacterium]|nr:MAG: hypothetical protein CR997_10775 [Acidobacteriota bacterium]
MLNSTSETNETRLWTVYLIECQDGTYYCGVCLLERLELRIAEHNSGKGARYTSARYPVKLITSTKGLNKQQAYRLEYRVKKMRRDKKIACLKNYRT